MRRLPHRLRPRWPLPLLWAGPLLVTAAWVILGLFMIRDDSLKPHQLKAAAVLLGLMSLLCVVALARPLGAAVFAGSTSVEVSRRRARRGETLRCFVEQRGAGLRSLDVRLQCLRELGRGSEPVALDLPLGSAAPDTPAALRAQIETEVLIPSDAPPSVLNKVRWRIRVAATFQAVPEVVREFPLIVV